jgi:hypothetical protein
MMSAFSGCERLQVIGIWAGDEEEKKKETQKADDIPSFISLSSSIWGTGS